MRKITVMGLLTCAIFLLYAFGSVNIEQETQTNTEMKQELIFNSSVKSLNQKLINKDSLKVGDLCPDFNMENKHKKRVKLSDLKGKYVFIDVWHSRCSPCIYEFPFIEELKSELNSNEIVFLGMNVDIRDFRWLGKMEYLKVQGTQWRVLDTEFEDKFRINYIPRFIVLDKEGRIINIKADKPSNPKTKKYLEQLLKK